MLNGWWMIYETHDQEMYQETLETDVHMKLKGLTLPGTWRPAGHLLDTCWTPGEIDLSAGKWSSTKGLGLQFWAPQLWFSSLFIHLRLGTQRAKPSLRQKTLREAQRKPWEMEDIIFFWLKIEKMDDKNI